MTETKNLLGLGLPGLDAHFSDVELVAAPPVGPADDCVLLPAQLHDHQVSDIHIGGDEERKSGVAFQDRPAGRKEERRSKVSSSVWTVCYIDAVRASMVCVCVCVFDICINGAFTVFIHGHETLLLTVCLNIFCNFHMHVSFFFPMTALQKESLHFNVRTLRRQCPPSLRGFQTEKSSLAAR